MILSGIYDSNRFLVTDARLCEHNDKIVISYLNYYRWYWEQKRLRNAEPLNCCLMSKGGRGGGRHQTSQTIQAQCDATVN